MTAATSTSVFVGVTGLPPGDPTGRPVFLVRWESGLISIAIGDDEVADLTDQLKLSTGHYVSQVWPCARVDYTTTIESTL